MKAVRVILLLIVLAGLGAAAYFATRSSSGRGGAELRSAQPEKQRAVRVEEKYGVTSEQAGP